MCGIIRKFVIKNKLIRFEEGSGSNKRVADENGFTFGRKISNVLIFVHLPETVGKGEPNTGFISNRQSAVYINCGEIIVLVVTIIWLA